jgi:hypothetical protein
MSNVPVDTLPRGAVNTVRELNYVFYALKSDAGLNGKSGNYNANASCMMAPVQR